MDRVEKNDIVVVDILDMNQDGEGVGKVNGYPLFIKDTVIGDKAEVKVIKALKSFGYGRLMRIIEPSSDRIQPRCAVAKQCGGCQLQAYAYEKQLIFKENKIRNHLERIGKIKDYMLEPIVGMEEPWRYRNKAQFPVGRNKDGEIVIGFYAGRTHSIIENEDCYLGEEINSEILKSVKEYMEENGVSPYDEAAHQGFVRHILIRRGHYTREILVCIVINGRKLPYKERLVEKLLKFKKDGLKSITLNYNEEKTNVILGTELEVLWGTDFITDMIGGITFQISPMSFYQVNIEQTEKLYKKVLEFADLTGKETVWDLYCGIGTISLFLAQKAKKVCGVEIVPQAVRDAEENARRNHFTNVEFFEGAAEEIVPEQYQKSNGSLKADVVTLDPPRKGCDAKLLETVVSMEPERIVYVSCDPATLARDLRYLCDRGYELKRVRACDMFGMGYHVEVVCLLSKLHAKQTIEVGLEMSEMDLTVAESKATYEEIKQYVLDKYGLKVSSLNIAQIKAKCGIVERENNNKAKNENVRQPNCTEENENVIKDAFKHFQMI